MYKFFKALVALIIVSLFVCFDFNANLAFIASVSGNSNVGEDSVDRSLFMHFRV